MASGEPWQKNGTLHTGDGGQLHVGCSKLIHERKTNLWPIVIHGLLLMFAHTSWDSPEVLVQHILDTLLC
jgi:hypothetical protein